MDEGGGGYGLGIEMPRKPWRARGHVTARTSSGRSEERSQR